ncbi:MAG: succinate dehydrogenase cytochrome b subunit [Bacteroidales bacterium]|nr:succinate dehydrogenase cytochrome b subunit [Bacteroidales bacterium]MBO7487389.1 succinate dehydrogenase cytochrome b subunit [Bacteroidales bacterium]
MSIFTSSIGKKLIMSITGLFLVLFLTMHMVLNFTSVFSAETFQAVCDFMALPIISILTPILALGFVIHIIYAFILSASNLKSRGGLKRYEVATKSETDSWAAKNMIYLGAIVLLGLAVHLTHFWSKMQLQEFMGSEAEDPNMLLANTFGNVWITILYLIWFVAIWLHLSHGFWSALQSIGWNNKIWLKRLKVIGIVYVTILMAGFAITAIVACCKANGLL